ncbi:MAG: glycoside hydrolase family 13 protein [Firmicutes bacterium]|nr:glycoside hydrolase family 13 protein [Bacillota bacterium]
MDKYAILHQSDSRFSFPVSATAARIRLRAKRDDTIKEVNVIWNTSHKFYLKQLKTSLEVRFSDALYDYYEGEIDNGCPGYSYLFQIVDGDGSVTYYNESGFDSVMRIREAFMDNFTVVFPNESDVVVANKQFEGRVFYQIFPERFAKSSRKKNASYIDMDWNTDEPVNDKFAGGDLDGIREKLPYLKKLGIGAIYMTPIHQSVSAHKYDIDDYFSVDKMFGDLNALKNLVDCAHANDIKIVMDLVFNHSSFYNPLFQDVVKKGKKSKYYDWYFVYGDKPEWDKGNYNTFCDVKMMPKLNTNNVEVQEYLCSVGEFYLRDYNVDGYRLDVAFDVSHAFWRKFKSRMKSVNPDVFIIGEDWQNSESFLGNDQWDSVMNYPFLYACQRFYASDRYNAAQFSDYLNSVLMRYKDGTNRMMLNLLDSHDIERFYNSVGFNKKLQLLAMATMMFYQGNPMLYYGDEIFMDGKQDPYNRKCMRWDSPEYNGAEHKVVCDLLAMRQSDVLKKGDIRICAKDGLVYITRCYDGKKLTLVVNHGKEAHSLCGKPVYTFNCADGQMLADSFAVYDN